MMLRDRFPGKDILFQGNRTLELRSLPQGAKISKAVVTVTPVDSAGRIQPSLDTIRFQNGENAGFVNAQPERLATRTVVAHQWVEIDFHGRRRLVSVEGSDLIDATLQVDVGAGSLIDINIDGAFKGPEDENFEIQHDNNPLPGLMVNRIKLSKATTPPAASLMVDAVTIQNVASNVSLGLGSLPPFWIHLGDMIEAQTSSDFAEFLQAFLSDAKVQNGSSVVPLVIHSDSLTRLNIDLEIEYSLQQNALKQGLHEVVLPYRYNGAAEADSDLMTINIPADTRVIPGETRGHVSGAFEDSRVAHETLEQENSTAAVEISPALTQAYLVAHENVLNVTAIDLLLEASEETVILQMDLRANLDGKPDAASLLAEPIDFTLDRKMLNQPQWVSVALPEGFRFEQPGSENRYWLVIQSKAGMAQWRVNRGTESGEPMQHSDNGGLSWRETFVDEQAITALFRLRNVPDRFQMPVELKVGSGDHAQTLSLERFNPTGRVDFSLDFSEVANTFNAYLDTAPQRDCPEREYLENGDFQKKLTLDQGVFQPVNWTITSGHVGYPHLQDSGAVFPLLSLGSESEHQSSTSLSQLTDVNEN